MVWPNVPISIYQFLANVPINLLAYFSIDLNLYNVCKRRWRPFVAMQIEEYPRFVGFPMQLITLIKAENIRNTCQDHVRSV